MCVCHVVVVYRLLSGSQRAIRKPHGWASPRLAALPAFLAHLHPPSARSEGRGSAAAGAAAGPGISHRPSPMSLVVLPPCCSLLYMRPFCNCSTWFRSCWGYCPHWALTPSLFSASQPPILPLLIRPFCNCSTWFRSCWVCCRPWGRTPTPSSCDGRRWQRWRPRAGPWVGCRTSVLRSGFEWVLWVRLFGCPCLDV